MTETIQYVTIRGRVQGVGYRAWVEHKATSLGLKGWVRNRRDGSVEALFAGPHEVVADMIAQCSSGPVSARVDTVVQEQGREDALDLRGPGESFSMLPTL